MRVERSVLGRCGCVDCWGWVSVGEGGGLEGSEGAMRRRRAVRQGAVVRVRRKGRTAGRRSNGDGKRLPTDQQSLRTGNTLTQSHPWGHRCDRLLKRVHVAPSESHCRSRRHNLRHSRICVLFQSCGRIRVSEAPFVLQVHGFG